MPPKHGVTAKYSNSAIQIDFAKCIGCNACVRACNKQQINVYTSNQQKGFPPIIQNDDLQQSNCIGCGQCASVCPTSAIVPKSDIQKMIDAKTQGKQLIALIAPATRFAVAEPFTKDTDNYIGSLIKLLKQKLGFQLVFDVNYGADETTLVDTEEFIKCIDEKKVGFTSCCPAWINVVEKYFPSLLPLVSTAKSCVEMLGAQVRKMYKDAYIVEIMPCTAKKDECQRFEQINCCITVVELCNELKILGVQQDDFQKNDNQLFTFDTPFNKVSSGSYIYGRSGGVSENVVRELSYELTGDYKNYTILEETKDDAGVVFKNIKINEMIIKIAICAGLDQVFSLCNKIQNNQLRVDIVEMMACPGGCQNGGGMPRNRNYLQRGLGMDQLDDLEDLKVAGANPGLACWSNHQQLHETYHTQYSDKSNCIFK